MIGGKQDIVAKQEIGTSKVTHDDDHMHFYPGEDYSLWGYHGCLEASRALWTNRGLKLLKCPMMMFYIPVQEDVTRLEVTMDDWRQAMFMKELQTNRSSVDNAKPSRPSKGSSFVEKSVQNRTIRHVIAHQHGAIACNSLEESSEGHYVGVLYWASMCNLVPKLLVNEHARFLCIQLLDGHIAMIILQLPLIHKPGIPSPN
jgi:hypothetical protein